MAAPSPRQMLPPGEAVLLYAPLDRAVGADEVALLSPDERQRAARLVHPLHRRRFLAARLFLRRALSPFAGLPPEALVFCTEPRGRPFLALPGAPAFNLSHSDELAMLAVAAGGAIGVDLERSHDLPDRDRVAATVMHPREWAAFEVLPEAERRAAFYRHWTRKEALLKAVGTGLAAEPRAAFVGLGAAPDPAPHLVRGQLCTIVDLPAPAGFAAALCAPAGTRLRENPPIPAQ